MKIAHLADIQIRAHSRHQEYAESFERLYVALRNHAPDRIVLAGDIVHNKTSMSPELVDLLASFLRHLSEIAIVDLILGNHDLSMKNLGRLDALSPVVNALASPTINFMKESGIYPQDGLNFAVMACQDPETAWPTFASLSSRQKKMINIALFHGTINGVLLDNGFAMASPHDLQIFEGFDFAMLGDIHRTQTMDAEGRVAYPGSFPKQNYAEALHGGFLLWNIEGKDKFTREFVEIPSVCPFYTIRLTDGQIPDAAIQESSRVRLLAPRLNTEERLRFTNEIRTKFHPSEIKIVCEDESVQNFVVKEGIAVSDLRNVEVQNGLLRDFLKEDCNERILEINQECNEMLPDDDVVRNVRYKVRNLEWENLFCFAGTNVLDFRKLKGLVCFFGRNASGKSSAATDVLPFCLFGKASKDIDLAECVHDAAPSGFANAEIEFNEAVFRIGRQTTKKKDGKTTTNLVFSKDGVDQKGIDRNETDKSIRKIFGTVDDFLRTSVAPQFDLLGFIENKAAERKKIIARYFDLEVFENKHRIANDRLKDLKRQIKDFDGVSEEEIQKLRVTLIAAKEKYETISSDFDKKSQAFAEMGATIAAKLGIPERKLREAQQEAKNIQAVAWVNKNQIEEKKEDIARFERFPCVANPDCCIKGEKFASERILVALTEKRSELREDMKKALQKIKDLEFIPDPEAEKLDNERDRASIHLSDVRCEKELAFRDVCRRESQIENFESKIGQARKIQAEFKALEHFAFAMSKDGISFQIIKDNLQLVNQEIQNIISDDMDFDLWLDDDGKEIDIWFQGKSGQEKKRRIEQGSGMQKTIAAIAIRAALISVTSLPVANIFVLDESFSTLDPENIEAMGRILKSLKRIFETIIVICHNDHVRDLCDKTITISNGQIFE